MAPAPYIPPNYVLWGDYRKSLTKSRSPSTDRIVSQSSSETPTFNTASLKDTSLDRKMTELFGSDPVKKVEVEKKCRVEAEKPRRSLNCREEERLKRKKHVDKYLLKLESTHNSRDTQQRVGNGSQTVVRLNDTSNSTSPMRETHTSTSIKHVDKQRKHSSDSRGNCREDHVDTTRVLDEMLSVPNSRVDVVSDASSISRKRVAHISHASDKKQNKDPSDKSNAERSLCLARGERGAIDGGGFRRGSTHKSSSNERDSSHRESLTEVSNNSNKSLKSQRDTRPIFEESPPPLEQSSDGGAQVLKRPHTFDSPPTDHKKSKTSSPASCDSGLGRSNGQKSPRADELHTDMKQKNVFHSVTKTADAVCPERRSSDDSKTSGTSVRVKTIRRHSDAVTPSTSPVRKHKPPSHRRSEDTVIGLDILFQPDKIRSGKEADNVKHLSAITKDSQPTEHRISSSNLEPKKKVSSKPDKIQVTVSDIKTWETTMTKGSLLTEPKLSPSSLEPKNKPVDKSDKIRSVKVSDKDICTTSTTITKDSKHTERKMPLSHRELKNKSSSKPDKIPVTVSDVKPRGTSITKDNLLTEQKISHASLEPKKKLPDKLDKIRTVTEKEDRKTTVVKDSQLIKQKVLHSNTEPRERPYVKTSETRDKTHREKLVRTEERSRRDGKDKEEKHREKSKSRSLESSTSKSLPKNAEGKPVSVHEQNSPKVTANGRSQENKFGDNLVQKCVSSGSNEAQAAKQKEPLANANKRSNVDSVSSKETSAKRREGEHKKKLPLAVDKSTDGKRRRERQSESHRSRYKEKGLKEDRYRKERLEHSLPESLSNGEEKQNVGNDSKKRERHPVENEDYQAELSCPKKGKCSHTSEIVPTANATETISADTSSRVQNELLMSLMPSPNNRNSPDELNVMNLEYQTEESSENVHKVIAKVCLRTDTENNILKTFVDFPAVSETLEHDEGNLCGGDIGSVDDRPRSVSSPNPADNLISEQTSLCVTSNPLNVPNMPARLLSPIPSPKPRIGLVSTVDVSERTDNSQRNVQVKHLPHGTVSVANLVAESTKQTFRAVETAVRTPSEAKSTVDIPPVETLSTCNLGEELVDDNQRTIPDTREAAGDVIEYSLMLPSPPVPYDSFMEPEYLSCSLNIGSPFPMQLTSLRDNLNEFTSIPEQDESEIEVNRAAVMSPPLSLQRQHKPDIEANLSAVMSPPVSLQRQQEPDIEANLSAVMSPPVSLQRQHEPDIEANLSAVMSPPISLQRQQEPDIEANRAAVVSPPSSVPRLDEPDMEANCAAVVSLSVSVPEKPLTGSKTAAVSSVATFEAITLTSASTSNAGGAVRHESHSPNVLQDKNTLVIETNTTDGADGDKLVEVPPQTLWGKIRCKDPASLLIAPTQHKSWGTVSEAPRPPSPHLLAPVVARAEEPKGLRKRRRRSAPSRDVVAQATDRQPSMPSLVAAESTLASEPIVDRRQSWPSQSVAQPVNQPRLPALVAVESSSIPEPCQSNQYVSVAGPESAQSQGLRLIPSNNNYTVPESDIDLRLFGFLIIKTHLLLCEILQNRAGASTIIHLFLMKYLNRTIKLQMKSQYNEFIKKFNKVYLKKRIIDMKAVQDVLGPMSYPFDVLDVYIDLIVGDISLQEFINFRLKNNGAHNQQRNVPSEHAVAAFHQLRQRQSPASAISRTTAVAPSGENQPPIQQIGILLSSLNPHQPIPHNRVGETHPVPGNNRYQQSVQQTYPVSVNHQYQQSVQQTSVNETYPVSVNHQYQQSVQQTSVNQTYPVSVNHQYQQSVQHTSVNQTYPVSVNHQYQQSVQQTSVNQTYPVSVNHQYQQSVQQTSVNQTYPVSVNHQYQPSGVQQTYPVSINRQYQQSVQQASVNQQYPVPLSNQYQQTVQHSSVNQVCPAPVNNQYRQIHQQAATIQTYRNPSNQTYCAPLNNQSQTQNGSLAHFILNQFNSSLSESAGNQSSRSPQEVQLSSQYSTGTSTASGNVQPFNTVQNTVSQSLSAVPTYSFASQSVQLERGALSNLRQQGCCQAQNITTNQGYSTTAVVHPASQMLNLSTPNINNFHSNQQPNQTANNLSFNVPESVPSSVESCNTGHLNPTQHINHGRDKTANQTRSNNTKAPRSRNAKTGGQSRPSQKRQPRSKTSRVSPPSAELAAVLLQPSNPRTGETRSGPGTKANQTPTSLAKSPHSYVQPSCEDSLCPDNIPQFGTDHLQQISNALNSRTGKMPPLIPIPENFVPSQFSHIERYRPGNETTSTSGETRGSPNVAVLPQKSPAGADSTVEAASSSANHLVTSELKEKSKTNIYRDAEETIITNLSTLSGVDENTYQNEKVVAASLSLAELQPDFNQSVVFVSLHAQAEVNSPGTRADEEPSATTAVKAVANGQRKTLEEASGLPSAKITTTLQKPEVEKSSALTPQQIEAIKCHKELMDTALELEKIEAAQKSRLLSDKRMVEKQLNKGLKVSATVVPKAASGSSSKLPKQRADINKPNNVNEIKATRQQTNKKVISSLVFKPSLIKSEPSLPFVVIPSGNLVSVRDMPSLNEDTTVVAKPACGSDARPAMAICSERVTSATPKSGGLEEISKNVAGEVSKPPTITEVAVSSKASSRTEPPTFTEVAVSPKEKSSRTEPPTFTEVAVSPKEKSSRTEPPTFTEVAVSPKEKSSRTEPPTFTKVSVSPKESLHKDETSSEKPPKEEIVSRGYTLDRCPLIASKMHAFKKASARREAKKKETESRPLPASRHYLEDDAEDDDAEEDSQRLVIDLASDSEDDSNKDLGFCTADEDVATHLPLPSRGNERNVRTISRDSGFQGGTSPMSPRDYHTCDYCLLEVNGSVAQLCLHCHKQQYCSVNCREKDWILKHHGDCENAPW